MTKIEEFIIKKENNNSVNTEFSSGNLQYA